MNISNLSMPRNFGGFDRAGNNFDLALTTVMQQIDALKANLVNLLAQLKALVPPMEPPPEAPASAAAAYAAMLSAYQAKVAMMVADFNQGQAKLVQTVAKLAALVAVSPQQIEKKRTAQQRAEMARCEIEGLAKTVAASTADVTVVQQKAVIDGAAVAFVGLTVTPSSGDGQSKQTYTGASAPTQAGGLPTGF